MDTALASADIKKFVDDNYIITHLVVGERDKNLDNEGAAALRRQYNGEGQWIPFWVVLNRKGKLLADSKLRKPGEGPDKGTNVGCPAKKEEVTHFISVLKKTSRLNDDQLKLIYIRFRENDPKYDHKDVYEPAAVANGINC